MSLSSNPDHLTNLVQPRNQSMGLNLSAKRAVKVYLNLKSEFIIIPSTSQPQFGSYFFLYYRDKQYYFRFYYKY